MSCDSFDLTLNNSQCVEMRGCILYGYKDGKKVAQDGVRPVPVQDNIRFRVTSPGMTHWRFVGAVDFSDNPENSDVVLIDTGERAMDKCERSITCRRGGPAPAVADKQRAASDSKYDVE
jgi:hypothetical protein